MLSAGAALKLAHADEGGDERLVHGFGDEIDEQAGDESGGEECIHGIGTAIDAGYSYFFEGGDELDDYAGCAHGEQGAQNAAVEGGRAGGRLVSGAVGDGAQKPALLVRMAARTRAMGTE